MNHSKLILIEGIPGSGKTTTARSVAERLEKRGQHPALYLEGDWDHPADFESMACLSEAEFALILAQFPAQAAFLSQYALHKDAEWFIKYRKLQHDHPQEIPVELVEALSRYDVYELPEADHRRLLVENWRRFSAKAQSGDLVYVFECPFLQNPITTLLAKHNLPIDAIHAHIWTLAEMVAPLQPRLIYLAPHDPQLVLEAARRERPQEWAEFVTGYLTGQEYGKAHGLFGYEGVIDFHIIRQALELEFVAELPMPSLVLSDLLSWEQRYRWLEAFLEL